MSVSHSLHSIDVLRPLVSMHCIAYFVPYSSLRATLAIHWSMIHRATLDDQPERTPLPRLRDVARSLGMWPEC